MTSADWLSNNFEKSDHKNIACNSIESFENIFPGDDSKQLEICPNRFRRHL